MATYHQNTFIGQRLHLDGNIFSGNTFQNCVLVYGGGSLNFYDNNLLGVQWEFVDAAARAVALLSSFYQQGGSSREFVETLLSTYGKQAVNPSASTTKESTDG